MIDAQTVGEILKQYEKHGWILRRALLSPEGKNSLTDLDVEIVESDLDALWFSRKSQPDSEAWELRRLSALPFALVVVVPTTSTTQEVDEALAQIEDDMRERTIA